MNVPPRSRRVFGVVLALLIAFAVNAPAQPVVAPPPRLVRTGPPLPTGAVARIGQPRLRFPGAVINVAFAPSGTTFVSTHSLNQKSTDTSRLVVLWDAATGQELRQFRGHVQGVEALAFSADGKHLATGGRDRTVRLWKVADGSAVRTFTGHTETVLTVAISPDGKQLASEATDATIRLWDAETGNEVKKLTGHRTRGTSNLRYSPDGKMLAAVGADMAIHLWNPATGTEIKKLTGPTSDSESLDFSRDGKWLAVISEDGKLWVWEVETKKELLRIEAHKTAGRPEEPVGICVRFSPDGSILATGGGDGRIVFWDAKSGNRLRTASGHPTNNLSEISFSADGSILASAGHDGTVRLWDVATAKELPQSGGQTTWIRLLPDGKRLATSSGEGPVTFWDLATGKELPGALKLEGTAKAMEFSADGRTLIVTDSLDELQLWDVETGKRTQKIGATTPISAARLAVGPGKVVASSNGASIRLWDVAARNRLNQLNHVLAGLERFPPLGAMTFCPDNVHLLAACGDGRIHLIDLVRGEELLAVPPAGQYSLSAATAWSPEGRLFAGVGSFDRSLRVWEAASGRERFVPVLLPFASLSVAFSPDGRLLAAGVGSSFHLWDARTGKQLATRATHKGDVTYLAFTPDGRYLVSAEAELAMPTQANPSQRVNGEGTALVWDVAALVKELPPLPKPTEAETERLWEMLKGESPVQAHEAIWRLATVPNLTLPLLKERLPKITRDGKDQQFVKLLAELDDDDYEVREKATQELIRIGPSVVGPVRQALATTKSREVKRRAEEIIAKVGTTATTKPDEILTARGVEVLQRIDTPEARQLLEEWAKSPADSPLTREAKLALRQTGKVP